MRFPIASTFALAAVGRLPGVLRRPRGWALAALLVALVACGGAFAHGRRAPRATTVSVPLTVTSTPRGAAILARIATGATTWDEALHAAPQAADERAITQPDPAQTTRYRERALRFRQIAEALTTGLRAV